MAPRRGVYFLANNTVHDRVVAFLNSFRSHNESIPLCLIPFDDDVDRIIQYQERYDFAVWSGDPAVLRTCDDISRSFLGEVKGHFRKLAAWEGEYDEFMYIDTDTVVLGDVGFAFDHLDRYGFVTTISDSPWVFKWVWRESIRTAGVLTPRQISYAANTGFLASRRECLRLTDVVARLPRALELAPHMALVTIEQPLLNYLIVTSEWPYTSLETVAEETGDATIPTERWAGLPMNEAGEGRLVTTESRPIFLVHWNGFWQEMERGEISEIPYRDLWNHYRYLQPAVRS